MNRHSMNRHGMNRHRMNRHVVTRRGRSSRAMFRPSAVVAALAVAVGSFAVIAAPADAATVFGQACPAGQNRIVCENARTGTPASTWDINGSGDTSIQGFATAMSVNLGGTESFKIKTNASAYSIQIYRLGWYQGNGARLVATVAPSATLPQTQPACVTNPATNLVDCGTWGTSASWQVPADAVSGVYIARLIRTDTGGDSHIPFIVRDDAGGSEVLFQTSDTTWQAYNAYGGANFYPGGANGRATKLSYNRPFTTRSDVPDGRDFLFGSEYPMIRFLERNGYDISYISGLDVSTRGTLLLGHRTFLSVGHDEYWSGAQRSNVEKARDAGVNLAFFSGNEVYWRTRLEPSVDGSATPDRTLVCYKETWDSRKSDPTSEWTGTWRDPRFTSAPNGNQPENALTGTAYMSNSASFPMQVPAEQGKLRLWRNTSVASLGAGQTATLAADTVGYESDEDLDNGFRPAGLVRLSRTTASTPEYLQDFGQVVQPGTTTHSMTLYRAPSGALVFGAGTIQFTWGLDSYHDGPGYASAGRAAAPDVRMQQATVNLLADMRAQPTTLMPGLVAATASADTVAPTVTITSPTSGSLPNGSLVTVTGTAADSGGIVGGVEVSLDAGLTWHPATGSSSWTYTGVLGGVGTGSIRARSVDDSGLVSAVATAGVTAACPCSLLGQSQPTAPAASDRSALQLGVRFIAQQDGVVQGIRFFKGTANTGTHTGTLWTVNGQVLGRGTFTNETASGWQELRFASPVPVTKGTAYVASYFAPNGGYHGDTNALYQGRPGTPLAIPATTPAVPVSLYGSGDAFPTNTYQATNYFVDVLFADAASVPLGVTDRSPVPDTSSVPADSSVVVGFTRPLADGSATVTVTPDGGSAVPVTVSVANTSNGATVTAVPTGGLLPGTRYTVTVNARDQSGAALSPPATWSFVTSYGSLTGSCPCALFPDTVPSGVITQSDPSPVELGVRFTPAQDGTVTGVRFLKVAGASGTHVGRLWSPGGALLSSATVTGETSSGWQQVLFAQPVVVTGGQTYTVSYTATDGRYPATANGFGASGVSRPPMSAAANAGAYTYSAGNLPSTASTSNYWVDALYRPKPADTTAPTVTATVPASGAPDVGTAATITATFAAPVKAGTTQVGVVDTATSTAVPGTLTVDAASGTLRFVPSSPLATGRTYRVTVSGATSTGGTVMSPYSWQFSTVAADQCPCSLFGTEALPAVGAADDTASVEVGTRFVPAADGQVTAIRFYKGTGNTGTHVGSIWSADGVRLAQVTFTGETTGGWQTATLASPLSVSAGVQYVVSYLAPTGRYAVTGQFFTQDWTRGALSAPGAGNGVYRYGGGFPTASYQGSNYFVDVVFEVPATTLTVTGRTPANGATGVPSASAVTATFSTAVSPGSVRLTATAAGQPVSGSTTYDATARTVTFVPAAALPADTTVTASVSAVSYAGVSLTGSTSWSFTTASAGSGSCPCSLLSPPRTPAVAASSDTAAVELGMSFTPQVTGTVTAIRFYKGTGNGGTHVGSLWSTSGQRLAQVTFTGETAGGWQTATLATPVAVTGGQTYVVSYYAPQGRYSVTYDAFTSPLTVGPLTAPAGANGTYRYGSGGGFPTGSYRSSNYWVDVVFSPA